ncbi:hypothetical protein ACH35V_29670 [Actinomadura sp. 1N219]|uniref:hypothetical protein n=1 Tax=Actinomadura sp. 1N219 TaxID=3375152 RepID=UPI0037B910F0
MRGRTAAAFRGAVATAGAALVLGLPGAAHAATGNFYYHTLPGSQYKEVLQDPADDTCHNITGIGEVNNDTDRTAVLYTPDCFQELSRIAPGQSEAHVTFGSVKFVR